MHSSMCLLYFLKLLKYKLNNFYFIGYRKWGIVSSWQIGFGFKIEKLEKEESNSAFYFHITF